MYKKDLKKFRATLLDFGYFKEFAEGEVIYSQGNKATYCYYLLEGVVQVYLTQSKKEQHLDLYSENDFFGEAFFTKRTRSASVRAMEKSKVVLFDQQRLVKMIESDPLVVFTLMGKLTAKIESFIVLKTTNEDALADAIKKNKQQLLESYKDTEVLIRELKGNAELIKAQEERIDIESLQNTLSLITTLNHEINNPLATISLATQKIRKLRQKEDLKTEKCICRIEDELTKISGILIKLSSMEKIHRTEYIKSVPMIDLKQ